MAIHGYTRLYTAIHGNTWLYMAIHGYTWHYMAIHGYTRLFWYISWYTLITLLKVPTDLDGSTPEPVVRASDTFKRIPCFDSCQLITTLMFNGCVHYQFSCALKLARKNEIEHWSRSSKTTGQRTASKYIMSPWWVDTWALDTAMWYLSVAVAFLTAVNWPYCEWPILKMWICQDTPETPLPSFW